MSLTRWIISPQARHCAPEEFIAELVNRLHAVNFPVTRMVFTLRTMHPTVWLESIRWSRAQGAYHHRRPHSFVDAPLFSESPVVQMYQGKAGFRRRLTVPVSEGDFPILHELQEQGFTDYLIAPLELTPGFFSYVSCSTDAPGGYSEDNLALWQELLLPLSVTVADMSSRVAMWSLLDTYLGEVASSYVRTGKFRRGDGESIESVIWLCDLRGFTRFTDLHPSSAVLARLNRYFDLVGQTLERHGGEILKFIGDAILAIFPISAEHDARAVATAATAAARDLLKQLSAQPESEGERLRLGVALHVGEVAFGNVGTAQRLDFTVIGGPVNEAARIEGLCKTLGKTVLLSEAVAKLLPDDVLESAGDHVLRGTTSPQRLFTLATSRGD